VAAATAECSLWVQLTCAPSRTRVEMGQKSMGSYSRRRFSSRLIFFLKFFTFMMCAPARVEGEFRVR